MATKSVQPVTRETSALVRERGLRAVMVTIVGGVIEVRAKGLRSLETVDVAWCYYAAVKQPSPSNAPSVSASEGRGRVGRVDPAFRPARRRPLAGSLVGDVRSAER